jgi:predicted enzyme related to lactoylglutathione lyase
MTEKYNSVGWFEIPVIEFSRAKEFYEHVFELELAENQMGPLQMAWFPWSEEAKGAAGSLVKGQGYEPSSEGVLVYFTVPDIEGALARAEHKGGKTITPRTDIREYGFIGHMLDCEGNRIGLHSRP